MTTANPTEQAAEAIMPGAPQQVEFSSTRPQQEAGYHAGNSPDASAEVDLGNWSVYPQAADADILPSKDLVDGRTTDLQQNSGIAEGSRQYVVNHIIGPDGLKLHATPDTFALGADEEWARGFSSELEAAFRSWVGVNSTRVDADDRLTWISVQTQAVNSLQNHGEILATFETDRNSKPFTKIRILDPARLSDPKDNPQALRDRNIVGGIEYDAKGKPVAYWISSRHPRDVIARNKRHDKLFWTRVPKYGRSGAQTVFHVFDPLRPAQGRGISALASVLRASKMLDKISNATLQNVLLQSVFATVVKSNASWPEILEALGPDTRETDGIKQLQKFMATREAFYSKNRIDIRGAKLVHLLPNEELDLKAVQNATPDVAAFIQDMHREVARGQGMTLEQLTGSYDKVNFSSARLSGAETHLGMAGRRNRAVAPFCAWVYGLFAHEYLLNNPQLLPTGVTLKTHLPYLTACRFTGSPAIQADPVKGAKAAELRLSNGTSTLQQECADMGLDWQDVMRQRAKESALAKELGLPDPHAGKEAAKAALPTPAEPKKVKKAKKSKAKATPATHTGNEESDQ